MNFYFIIRILSLISMIIGSFFLTFSVWAVYVRYCSMYHTVLEVNPGFADYFSPRYYDCNSTEWSEWSSCSNNNTVTTTTKRFRENAACKRIEDSKPCLCPVDDNLCNAVRVNQQLNFECINSLQNSSLTEPFLIRGSSDNRLSCPLFNNT